MSSLLYDKNQNQYWLKTYPECCVCEFFGLDVQYWKINKDLKLKLSKNEKPVFNIKIPFSNFGEIILEDMNQSILEEKTCKCKKIEIIKMVEVQIFDKNIKQSGETWCKIAHIKKKGKLKKVLRFRLNWNNKQFFKYIDIPLNISIKE